MEAYCNIKTNLLNYWRFHENVEKGDEIGGIYGGNPLKAL
jgi:hypothetical protein